LNLPGCLASLGWSDQVVVVVDPASRDQTEAIARERADAVIVRPFDDFASQRNAGLDAAKGDWIFSIDADERVTPALAAEIRRVVSDPAATHAGYKVPIKSVILGRAFSHSGTQHDLPMRLFRRRAGSWVGAVHETVDLRGSVGSMRHHLEHRTIPDLDVFLKKISAYTSLEARQFHEQGRPVRVVDLTLRPIWTFAKLYVGKRGYRDGAEGFLFCALSGVSVAVRHWKHRELARSGGSERAA
jgi:glycosyltransferase involved in cell wall biosynthesis